MEELTNEPIKRTPTDSPERKKTRQVNPYLGWSLLEEDLPPEQFSLETLMRENEITQITKIIKRGGKIIIYGDDGWGKTTLVRELVATLRTWSRPFYFAGHTNFRSLEGMETLRQSFKSPPTSKEPPVIILDSADYLWEEAENPQLAQRRVEIFQELLASESPVVITAHKNEPPGKKVDWRKQREFRQMILSSQAETMELSRLYPRQKVIDFLQRLGFEPEVAEVTTNASPWTANHTILKNYFLPHWREKGLDQYLNTIYKKRGAEFLKETAKAIFLRHRIAMAEKRKH